MRLGLMMAAAVLALDQISKWLVVELLMRPEGVTETPFLAARHFELTPFFNVVMAWNRGVSFGVLNNDSPYNAVLLTILALVIVGVLMMWMRKAESRIMAAALGLIVGGALGNVIDRIRYGAVADFLDFHVSGWHWPAFNVADSGITVGAILLIADSLFARRTSH